MRLQPMYCSAGFLFFNSFPWLFFVEALSGSPPSESQHHHHRHPDHSRTDESKCVRQTLYTT